MSPGHQKKFRKTSIYLLFLADLPTTEVREVTATPVSTSTVETAPVNWGGSEKPSCWEIIVYSVLKHFYPCEPYKVRAADKYANVVVTANLFLYSAEQIGGGQLYNYLRKAKTSAGSVGKYRGKVRFKRFASIVSATCLSVMPCLKKAADHGLDGHEVLELRKVVEEAILLWENPTGQSNDIHDISLQSLQEDVSKLPSW